MQKLGPKAQAAIDEVLSRFERGDLSPVTEIIRIRREGGEHPSDRWTFANQVLSFITSGSLDTRGIRQWNEVGRKVKKGSKAGFILIPITRKVEKEDPQTGEMVERSLPVGFKSCPVFAVESTEGDPVTLPDYTPAELPPLMNVAESWGLAVKWTPDLPSRYLGWYRHGEREIALATEDERLFFHELAHGAHSRIEGPNHGKGQDPRREAVAEFSACVLMSLYGLRDTTGESWQYIKGYNKDPLKALYKVLNDCKAVIDEILMEADRLQAQQQAA
jgi:hypothetical protein